jgi:hypothetical protein
MVLKDSAVPFEHLSSVVYDPGACQQSASEAQARVLALSNQALSANRRLFFFQPLRYTPSPMSIRKAGGDWEPMLLPIEPRHCKVCQQGLYRDKTMFRGGWSRCTVCDEFVHYSCLASGKVSFLKARPRVCKTCRAAQEGAHPSAKKNAPAPVAVGS